MQFVSTMLGAQEPSGPKNKSGYLGIMLDGQVELNSLNVDKFLKVFFFFIKQNVRNIP